MGALVLGGVGRLAVQVDRALLGPKLGVKRLVAANFLTSKNLRAQARATDGVARVMYPPYFLFAQDSIADVMASIDACAPGAVQGAVLAAAELSLNRRPCAA